MNTKLLSVADVSEAAGLSTRELRGWCDKGIVVPDAGGEGQGDHRMFSVVRTVGVAVAVQVRNTSQGCVPEYVKQVVAAFASMDEKDLLKEFKKGQTHLVMVHYGKPILRGKEYDWVDVQATYQNVTKKIAKIEQRYAGFVGGRGRGLATHATSEATS
jgi:DNA-binding transcriptional MerR regulator